MVRIRICSRFIYMNIFTYPFLSWVYSNVYVYSRSENRSISIKYFIYHSLPRIYSNVRACMHVFISERVLSFASGLTRFYCIYFPTPLSPPLSLMLLLKLRGCAWSGVNDDWASIVCTYMCMYINIHIYIYTCIYMCVYTYIYICIYLYVYVYLYVYTYLWVSLMTRLQLFYWCL